MDHSRRTEGAVGLSLTWEAVSQQARDLCHALRGNFGQDRRPQVRRNMLSAIEAMVPDLLHSHCACRSMQTGAFTGEAIGARPFKDARDHLSATGYGATIWMRRARQSV